MEEVMVYFILFIVYAFIGFCIEVIGKLFQYHRLINRGFLIGPWLPIYGSGALFMTLFLTKYKSDLLVLMGMGMLICSILEYITSYLMEKLFRARWWDYSHYKFNLNGRICLSNAILFGVGGIVIICVTNPILLPILNHMPHYLLVTIATILFVLFLLDNFLSFKIMSEFKKCAMNIMQDSTEEIRKKVSLEALKISRKFKQNVDILVQRMQKKHYIFSTKSEEKAKALTEQIKRIYQDKSYFSRRIIESFPNFTAIINEKRKANESTQSKRSKNKK